MVGLILVSIGWWATDRTAPPSRSRPDISFRGSNVIVVTIDTLRPDHLGAYGYKPIDTPNIDRLAREGIRFNAAYTPVPLTLPSHASILTGLLPFTHGVRDNGGYYLDATRPTLATVLKAQGYRTGGFVSTFLLDSRWGVARGFDHYFDNFNVSLGDLNAMARVQRPASETWAHAKRWLDTNASEPFFLWMHLYDPHTPYAPPEPFRSRYSGRLYDGEIAYVDSVLGETVADLQHKALLDKTVIVLLSDHGEGLGEHDEDEHGLLTYDSTLRVPWIMRLPHGQGAGTVVDEPVSLVDVFPTILQLIGALVPAGLDGVSRALAVSNPTGRAGDVLYAESFYPRLRFGWSELTTVRNDRFKLIRAPNPELYDYRADPNESTNLAKSEPAVAARLDQVLTRLVTARAPEPPRHSAESADTAARLSALGYFSGAPVGAAPSVLADPKEKRQLYRRLMRARQLLDEGAEQEGLKTLEGVVSDDPELAQAHRLLREYWVAHRRFADARAWLRAALSRRPGDGRLLVDLASIDRAMGNLDEARSLLADATTRHPDDPEALTLYGEVLRDSRQFDAALGAFARAEKLSAEPNAVKLQEARTLFEMQRFGEAERTLAGVLAADAHVSGAHYLLAQIAELQQDPVRAESEYRQEIERSPGDFQARFNLSALLGRRGDHADQLVLLESIPALEPTFHDVHFYIAKALLDTGDAKRWEEAIAAAQEGLRLAPSSPAAPLGHYVLADVYRLQGRPADSQRELAQGQELEARIAGRRRP